MAQAERPNGKPQIGGQRGCRVVQLEARRAALPVYDHFDVVPADPLSPDACSQSFGSGLLCGKARRQRFHTSATIGQLPLGEDPGEEVLAVPVDGLENALDLDEIDTCAQNHAKNPQRKVMPATDEHR